MEGHTLLRDDTADRDLPPLQPYRPMTFLERGVAVPFSRRYWTAPAPGPAHAPMWN